jgi:hypothetical protein
MTRNEFILQIKDELRGSCALPYSVPDAEINRLIDQAKKWFYRNYKEAVETQYYVIEKEHFDTAEFKATRTILLPDCVVSVFEVKEISGGGRLLSIDKDFSDNRLIAAELYLSPFQSDDLVMRTVQYAYWDLAQAFFLDRIAFDHNQHTHKLKILGRNPNKNVFIQTYVEIPEEQLFEDWYFIRYVTAQAKIALGRILGFFEYQLPGGITINSSDIKSEGQDELAKILEDIDGEQSADWFFIWHSFLPPITLGSLVASLF